MNREIKVGDWGWFWDDNHEDVLFGQLVNICDGLNGMFDTFDSRHYHFSHEHPTGRFIVTENPNSVSNDPYAELKKAYEECKWIQMKTRNARGWIDCFKRGNGIPPNWNDSPENYRIKPEARYRPYAWEDREEFRGKWIQYDGDDNERQIVDIGPQGISWEPERIFSYDELFRYCKFTDGTPFGKLIEE